MRSALAHAAQKRAGRRQRAASLTTVPPAETSSEYSSQLATAAASILYRSPLPSGAGRPVYILNAAAFPDAWEVDYDSLLSYVLARLPGEDELLSGTEYEIIFFAGGQPDNATSDKKQGPGMGWYLQAYHILSRAMRKRLQKLYIVHPRTWVRVLVGVFGTIVSPKFRRKIIHVNTLSALALQIPIEKLLIPPAVYLHDRKLSPDIYAPFVTGKRAFGVKHPLPKSLMTGETRLPRVLRETTSFLLHPTNVTREGLFRIPGHSTLISVLKEAYDRGQSYIVWKEKDVMIVHPEIDHPLVDELRFEDAYGLSLAASLIKQWYRDLREPIFPESCYTSLRERYLNPDTLVTPEDLVEIILPASEISPLTKTAREILTRHLLPVLHEVATHEAENKMNSENLSILFSMCLVCGPDQMEDAKIASIVKRLLQATLDMWPQLRDGMGISAEALNMDLRPPKDLNEYEDPLEENLPPPQRDVRHKPPEIDTSTEHEEHRIVLEDTEISPAKREPPKIPLRVLDRSRPDQLNPNRAPNLPPRPAIVSVSSSGSAPGSSGSESAPAFPKRKPAPPILDPPRYSSVFDVEGNSIHVADSPASYVPADGFGPPKHGPWSYDESEKKGFAPAESFQRGDARFRPAVPNRKAVSTERKLNGEAASMSGSRSASGESTTAQMAAESATTMRGNSDTAASSSLRSADATRLPEKGSAEDDEVFRKPSWPASARAQSLAKPVQPLRQAQTFPVAVNGNHLTAANVPKSRSPSPGLLQRMSSYEGTTSTDSSNRLSLPAPNRLDLLRPSVDDIRRLYEERASTVQGLAEVDLARRRASTSN